MFYLNIRYLKVIIKQIFFITDRITVKKLLQYKKNNMSDRISAADSLPYDT